MNGTARARDLLGLAFSVPADEVPLDASIERCERWDSLAHLNLVIAIEETLGHPLDTATLLSIESLDDVARLLETEAA